MIKNAIIIKATLGGIEGEGYPLTAWLHLDYGDSMQGFGGYVLYSSRGLSEKNYAGHFIQRCLDVAEVAEWADLKGKTVRVDVGESPNAAIDGIGHIVKDDWFYPKKDFAV